MECPICGVTLVRMSSPVSYLITLARNDVFENGSCCSNLVIYTGTFATIIVVRFPNPLASGRHSWQLGNLTTIID